MLNTSKYALGLIVASVFLTVPVPHQALGQVMDDKVYSYILFDRLDYAPGPETQPVSVEAMSWTGGDINRLWVRAEGEQSTLGRDGEAEVEVLYGRLISPFFDVVGGVRVDREWGGESANRGFVALGLQGMAPYRFEIEPTLYVSHEGDVSAQFSAAYHMLLTQRLVFEPEMEMKAAVQDVPEWGVGSGVNDVGLALLLRYEVRREFAPYVGYTHDWTFGETADLARAAGGETSGGAFVFGVRIWH